MAADLSSEPVIGDFHRAVIVGLLLAAYAAADELQALRPNTELFVDDANVAFQTNVTRRIHPARRLARPVVEPDRPWEGEGVYLYGTVWRDAPIGRFKMWYGGGGMLLATSEDGLTWCKPEFDVERFDGQKTNIVLRGGQVAGVVVDKSDPDPNQRYKALLGQSIRIGGFRGYHSADGIHWQPYADERILPAGSEIGHVMRDPATKKYFAYIRPFGPKLHPKSAEEKRLGAVTTSEDFIHWSEMKITLTPDVVDDAWVTGVDQRTEFYAMNGFAYGRSYLGITPVFRITRILESWDHGQSRYDGPMDGQLIVSRDGLTWSRMRERDWILPGREGFDRSIMNVATAPLIVGDEIWHYYTAINTTHGGPRPPKRITIGLARWRLDGYVSLDAGGEEGVVETTPRSAADAALEINADASAGYVTVEVLDVAGRVIEGYGAEACVRLTGDRIRYPIHWGEHGGLPVRQEFRLRFRLKNASLFSYSLKTHDGHVHN